MVHRQQCKGRRFELSWQSSQWPWLHDTEHLNDKGVGRRGQVLLNTYHNFQQQGEFALNMPFK